MEKTDRQRLLERVRDSEEAFKRWMAARRKMFDDYCKRIVTDWNSEVKPDADNET